MIVLLRRRPRGQHAKAPRHSEMQDEMADAAIDEQVLAAAVDRSHLAARKVVNVLRHRPAQPRLAHRHARDHAAGELRLARRAVEVANQARMPELALEAAKTWHELDPSSSHALQVVAALLVSAKRVDDALPYLEKLLSTEGVNLENGFMQLNRLLAGNPDKAANLRVVRQLASRHPQLPQAHFAIAQAAAS